MTTAPTTAPYIGVHERHGLLSHADHARLYPPIDSSPAYLTVDGERMSIGHTPRVGELIADVEFLRNGKRRVRVVSVTDPEVGLPEAVGVVTWDRV